MSWKSLVSAGLLCVLASPAFAAPQLDIVNGGPILDAQGNWVWTVRVAPTAAGSPLDIEAALAAVGGNILSVSNASPSIWDTNNPGNAPASHVWVKTYGTPLKPEALQGNFEGAVAGTTVLNGATLGGTTAATGCEGAAANCAGVPADAGQNQIFVALGSKDLVSGDLTQPMIATAALGTNLLTIVQKGPIDGASTSTVTLSGAYDGANNSARIAEITGTNTSANYKNFSGSATRFVVPGDANLSDGVLGTTPAVTGSDLVILATHLGQAGVKTWHEGDFNASGTVTGADLVTLATHLGQTSAGHVGTYAPLSRVGMVDPPGSGAGLEGGAVPEPASIALMGLALLGGLGLLGRKR